MENQPNIPSIIQNNQLEQFILGEEENYVQYTEDVDKQRKQLIEYYNDPANPGDAKGAIKKVVLDLFDKPDADAKEAALILSKKMNIDGIRNKIIKAVEERDFVHWKKYVQRSLLIVAVHFQILELEEFIATTVIEDQIISYFFQWSERSLEYNYVGQDDLWKISILAKLYNNSSSTTQEFIINQLVFSAKEIPRVHHAVRAFITQNSQMYPGFCKSTNQVWVQKYKYPF